MKTFLQLAGTLLLLVTSAGVIVVSQAVWNVATQTEKVEVTLQNEIKTLPGELDVATRSLNSQLSDLNVTLNKTSAGLLAQTGVLSSSLSHTLAGVDTTTSQLTETMSSINRVVANPDIPALVRDTRITVALTGSTMAHVRTTANVIAEQSPAIGKSATDIAANVAGVTKDVHKLTSDFTAPKPLWKKILSGITDAAGIARFF